MSHFDHRKILLNPSLGFGHQYGPYIRVVCTGLYSVVTRSKAFMKAFCVRTDSDNKHSVSLRY